MMITIIMMVMMIIDGATIAEEKSNSRAYSLRVAPPDKGFPNIPSMVQLLMTRSEIIFLKNMG